jgi:hypothetical protein
MIQPHPSSYRDPDARVYRGPGDRILRCLGPDASARLAHFRRNGLLDQLTERGLFVETWVPLDVAPPKGWRAIVESRAVRPVSYPYEWSFGMLQDAALLTLRLTRTLLAEGAILRDASAYNLLFAGHRPVFVDVGSLGLHDEGQPWAGYGQFCDHFLAPLLLEAIKGVPFQPLLRASMEGIPASTLATFLGPLACLRHGVLADVHLRAWLERGARTFRLDERKRVGAIRIPTGALDRQLSRLERVVGGLRSRAHTVWASYERGSYDEPATATKDAFVSRACDHVKRWGTAWDVGANTGRHARILADRVATVVAMDADPGAVDVFYRSLKADPPPARVLPLVVDVANPSPAQGWRGAERSDLESRSRPDLALYLALLHHLCLGRGLPLPAVVDWIAETSELAVIEFVSADDPLSRLLMATRPPTHAGYDELSFRRLCQARGRIVGEQRLSATRLLVLFASAVRRFA